MDAETLTILQIGGSIVAAFLGGGLFSFLLSRRAQPSQIKQTEATTDTIKIDNERKRDERFDYVVNRTETDAIARLKVYDELESLKRKELVRIDEALAFQTKIAGLETQVKHLLEGDVIKDQQIVNLTKRAELAEKELANMREWVPERIRKLELEVREWKDIASGNTSARLTEADTKNIEAHTAAAVQAGAQQPQAPPASADAVTLSAPIQINVVEKPPDAPP